MPNQRRITVVIWAITAVALVLRLARFVHAGARTGIAGYDDGVYFGASVRLVHGSLPYRDFVFVHPPVIAEVFAPLAAFAPHVSTVTLVFLGRLLTVLVSTATIPLVGWLLRDHGAVAVAVGCGTLAVHEIAVAITRATLIEAYLAFFFVLGLALLFDRSTFAGPTRTFWAGVVLGVAIATKLWALVPVVVLLLVCLRDLPRLRRLSLGVVLGAVVPCLPFLLTTPGTFVHDVVVSQLTRTSTRVPIKERLADLLGLDALTEHRRTTVIVVFVALIVMLVVGYAQYWRSVDRPGAVDLAVVGCTVATGLMFLVPSEFYWHYGGFFAPFLALALALSAGHLAASGRTAVTAAWYAVGGVVLVACLISCIDGIITPDWSQVDSATIDAAVPRHACVLTNDASLALAVDRMPTSSACRVVVDAVGTAFVKADGLQGRRARGAPALRRTWLEAARTADVVLFNRAWLRVVPVRALGRYLHTRFERIPSGNRNVLLYVRTARP